MLWTDTSFSRSAGPRLRRSVAIHIPLLLVNFFDHAARCVWISAAAARPNFFAIFAEAVDLVHSRVILLCLDVLLESLLKVGPQCQLGVLWHARRKLHLVDLASHDGVDGLIGA